MENYVNKIAIVTGASSGIGAGLSKELAKRGCIVIGLARRMDKLKVRMCMLVNTLPIMYMKSKNYQIKNK